MEYGDNHKDIEYTNKHIDNARAELKVKTRVEAKEVPRVDRRRTEEGRAAAGCETTKGWTQEAVERKHGVQQLKEIIRECGEGSRRGETPSTALSAVKVWRARKAEEEKLER